MNSIPLLIISGSLSTMAPRILPYFMPFLNKLPKKIRKMMMLMPLSALGALIFPLALTDFSSEWICGLLGVLSAFIASYFRKSMVFSIILSLLVTYFSLQLFF